MLEIIGVLQRGQANRKLSSIDGHLRTQQSELLRREMLPKYPVCKLSIEPGASKCPHCHDRLVWIAAIPFADTPNNTHLSSLVVSLAEQYNSHCMDQKSLIRVRRDVQKTIKAIEENSAFDEVGQVRKSISYQLATIDGHAFYRAMNDNDLAEFIDRKTAKLPAPKWLSWEPYFLVLVVLWIIQAFRLFNARPVESDKLNDWVLALPLVCFSSIVISRGFSYFYAKSRTEQSLQLVESHRETITIAAKMEKEIRSLQDHVKRASGTFEALVVLRQHENLLTAKAAGIVRSIPANNPFSSVLHGVENRLPGWLVGLSR